jgi:hypothetical protein
MTALSNNNTHFDQQPHTASRYYCSSVMFVTALSRHHHSHTITDRQEEMRKKSPPLSVASPLLQFSNKYAFTDTTRAQPERETRLPHPLRLRACAPCAAYGARLCSGRATTATAAQKEWVLLIYQHSGRIKITIFASWQHLCLCPCLL